MTRLAAVFALSLALLSLPGCSSGRGGGSSTPQSAVPVKVTGGIVPVYNAGCGEIDLVRVRSELETAWRRAVSEMPEVAEIGWRGFRLVFDPLESTGRYVGNGEARIGCGKYGAVEHEPGHHWCHALGRCGCADTWHPGGRDLSCRRLEG